MVSLLLNNPKFIKEPRNSSLDFLKIFLVSLVIIGHSALPYFIGLNGVWYVHSKAFNYDFFVPWFFSINAFVINTFFFIAGILSYFSIKKHNILPFVKSRIRRIFIPLLLGFLFRIRTSSARWICRLFVFLLVWIETKTSWLGW